MVLPYGRMWASYCFSYNTGKFYFIMLKLKVRQEYYIYFMIANTYILLFSKRQEGHTIKFSVIVHVVILKILIFFLLVCFSILNCFTPRNFHHCSLFKTLSIPSPRVNCFQFLQWVDSCWSLYSLSLNDVLIFLWSIFQF